MLVSEFDEPEGDPPADFAVDHLALTGGVLIKSENMLRHGIFFAAGVERIVGLSQDCDFSTAVVRKWSFSNV